MKRVWYDDAWDDYLYWQNQDKKILKKINGLIKSMEHNGYECEGHPEPLRGDLSGWWSVAIDKKNRIVFRIEEDVLEIWQCGSHYRDK